MCLRGIAGSRARLLLLAFPGAVAALLLLLLAGTDRNAAEAIAAGVGLVAIVAVWVTHVLHREHLRAHEQRFRRVFLESPDAVAISADPEGVYLDVNDEFLRLGGLRREEVIGRTPEALGVWVDSRDFRFVLGEIREKRVVRDLETRFRTRDGSVIWVLYSATPFDLEDRSCFVSFIRDVTPLKRAEATIAEVLVHAQNADRLKSAFLANVSHEIRTPLNVIVGYTTLFAEWVREQGVEPYPGMGEAIERASRRLLESVTGALDLSKLELGDFPISPTTVELAPLLHRLAAHFKPFAEEKGLAISFAIEEEDVVVHFDEYCLSQSLSKLIDNAIKFTEFGRVGVTLRRAEDGALSVDVVDTGIGIDEGYLSQLFEPFTQGDTGYTRRFEGSGLGLALAKRHLALNGASLEVETRKGAGTTFRVRFPRSLLREGSTRGSGPRFVRKSCG